MVSLADLATKTGYSVSVVSRALNPNPDKHSNIAEQTREKIQAAAREAGYRPNHAASFAKRGMNATVGVFLPFSDSDLMTQLISGISSVLAEENFPMKLYFDLHADAYLRFMRDMISRSHAGIITYPAFDVHEHERIQRVLRAFLDKGGRCISINTSVDYLSDQMPHDVPVVTIDNVKGGRLAAQHLIERGCRSFMNFNLSPSDCFARRSEGFRDALDQAGLRARSVTLANAPRADGISVEELRREILRTVETADRRLPLGIFSESDTLAMQVLRALAGTDLRVPEHVKIVGFDDSFMARVANPPLTTLRQPFEQEGKLVARKIVNMVYRNMAEQSQTLEPELIVREST
jgi:LacI family sucrose operon transcriptional repressor